MSQALCISGHPQKFSLSSAKKISFRVYSLSFQNNTDRELVSLTKSGHKKAFEVLITRWQDSIYTLCYRKLSHQEQAEELTQEIFLAAYRHISSFRNESKFSTWLFQIAINRCKNLHGYRERRKHRSHEPLEGTNPNQKRDFPDTSPSAVQILHRKEQEAKLRTALEQLDDKYKEVLILFDIQGLPQNEIATILNLPVGTVKSRIHRARGELANLLKGIINPKDIGEAK
jgi:RNA polymerase sigma-70 factor, ECF subfamily